MTGYIEKGKNLTTNYLHSAFEHMKVQSIDALGQQVDKLSIGRDVFAGRVARLQEQGLIINTVDFDPS